MKIKIFKISTKQLWHLKNKTELIHFLFIETGYILPQNFTIKKLISYLPREEYYLLTKEDQI